MLIYYQNPSINCDMLTILSYGLEEWTLKMKYLRKLGPFKMRMKGEKLHIFYPLTNDKYALSLISLFFNVIETSSIYF